MENPIAMLHRATPEQWAAVERWGGTLTACLLELRSRLEALEASATCPHVVTSDEGTSYCGLAEHVAAEPMPGMTDCFFVGPPPAPHKSVSEWYEQEGSKGILHGLYISPLPSRGGPKPDHVRDATEMVPAGSLVERVGRAISLDAWDDAGNWTAEARAAIREVAAWLDTKGWHACSLCLREEVEQ